MAYYRGDYYRGGRMVGDYYRGRGAGDPFWGALLRGITSVGRAVLGFPVAAPTAASAAAGAGATAGAAATAGRIAATALPAVLAARPAPTSIIPAGIATAARRVARSPTAQMIAAGTVVEMGGRLYDQVTGEPLRRKYRRINPANPKALRRSIKRVVAFGRLCASARTAVGKAATQLQYGGRRRRAPVTALARTR